MKLTPWMLAIAAFMIIAALAVGFVFKRMFAAEPVQAMAPLRENVPVALSDIEPGTEMEGSFLADAPILTSKINEYRDVVKSRSAIIGRIAKERIPMATPLRLSMFYPFNQGPSIEIAAGYRLVSVSVGDSTGMVSGLIKSGSYVDVMMTVDASVRANDRGRGQEAMALQLFDGVRVYEVNRGSNREVRQEVVLELTPDQQRIMVLAKEKGRISLTYNPEGPGNGGVSVHALRSDRILLSEILGYEEPTEEKVEPFVTEQYRNGGRSNAFYDKTGNRIQPPRGSLQTPVGGTDNGGVPLQGSGGSNWFSTSNQSSATDAISQQASARDLTAGSF